MSGDRCVMPPEQIIGYMMVKTDRDQCSSRSDESIDDNRNAMGGSAKDKATDTGNFIAAKGSQNGNGISQIAGIDGYGSTDHLYFPP